MIDFNWTSLTLGLSFAFLFSFCLYFLMYYGKCVSHPNWQQSERNWGLMIFSLILIIMVCDSNRSDWFSYQSMVWNYDFSIGAVNHGEPVYYYIIKFVNRNYFLFRVVVWGGAFLLACLTFRRFGVNVNIAAFLLVAAFLLKFNYARATLAMASYFMGLSFLLKPIKNRKLLSLLLTALFFYGAYEFHNSLLAVLLLTVLAYIPLKKPYLLIIIFLLPVWGSYISTNLEILNEFGDESVISRFNSYLDFSVEGANILGYITSTINYASFFVPLLFISIAIDKNRSNIELSFIRLTRVMIGISLLAASFLFMGLKSQLFVYRYLHVIFIPIAILSAYLYENKYFGEIKFSIIIIIGFINNFISLLVGLVHTMR